MRYHDPRNKYGVSPIDQRTWHGLFHWERTIYFDSKAELRRFCELYLLQENGAISGLILQPRFEIAPGIDNVAPMYYVGDFFYYENGKKICEDVKGRITAKYKQSIKRAKALYSYINFVEVKV